MDLNKNCIDEYISEQAENKQESLKQIRDTIRSVLPNAQERISWRMPTYWDGHNIIHFAAFKNHMGLYPGPDVIVHFKDQLKDFKTSKGAIQFPYNQDLPLELIKKITQWCYQTGKHH